MMNVASPQIIKNTLIIVKTDAIGDYILFRNLLNYIRQSEKYKDYHITLCGNILWKDLALMLDNECINAWIWLDRKKFVTDLKYRRKFLKDINSRGFEIAVNPNRSRYLEIDDALIKATGHAERIGRKGDLSNIPTILQKITMGIYSRLIDEPKSEIFEFSTNKYFVEKWLETTIEIELPYIQSNKHNDKYIVIIPGSGETVKQWKPEKFVDICIYLHQRFKQIIYIIGSSSDSEIAETILKGCINIPVINLCGKTTLSELVDFIANAGIVLGNDTGAIHIAAAVKVPTICLINGIHFGRFGPYPEDASWVHFIYPDPIQKNMHDKFEVFTQLFKHQTPYNVNQIEVLEVEMAIERFF